MSIDLNGNNVSAPTTTGCKVIYGNLAANLTIFNGSISGGEDGIFLKDTTAGGGYYKIHEISFTGAASISLGIEGDSPTTCPNPARAIVNDNVVLNSTTLGSAISLNCTAGSIVERNIIQQANSAIFLMASSNTLLRKNTVKSSGRDGIMINSSKFNIIDMNVITDSGKDGIAGSGIWMTNSSYNKITRNNLSGNFDHGIFIVDSTNTYGNTIKENLMSNNGQCGIYFTAATNVSPNVYAGNVALNNGTAGYCDNTTCGTGGMCNIDVNYAGSTNQ